MAYLIYVKFKSNIFCFSRFVEGCYSAHTVHATPTFCLCKVKIRKNSEFQMFSWSMLIRLLKGIELGICGPEPLTLQPHHCYRGQTLLIGGFRCFGPP